MSARWKTVVIFSSVWLALAFWASRPSVGEEAPSPELLKLGRELFTTTGKLGTQYACILCHQKDKAIKRASVEKLGEKLPDVINLHIAEKSKGTPIAKESEEMKALAAYITHEHSV